ncbi:TonB-dependent receptor [Sphingomonas gellani]|uniref:TonB-dependent receptor n=1 Tax=Sphingomonas gellani TaxID=1166340 RepID=A0A1H8GNI5_9SPHN|nr:TonB-dependent receptor [Sphingomonas gellani]SEN45582.1 TonB-dependent receptor [Sphingomonas gellani]
MRGFTARSLSRFFIGTSAVALAGVSASAWAQDAAATVGNSGSSEIAPQPQSDAGQPASATVDPTEAGEDVVVTGIRASLRASQDIKREGQGIVDAISAEDIGKFPDTNLAESLQRITGVSIDRSNGEGSFVTVRGLGPEYNLVVLNGRQLPTSVIGDGNSAPGSRAFDFANLASEGIAALEVYKSGRASVPSGGIGSTINIRTPRPFDKMGTRGSVAARGVVDTSQNGKNDITPEVSGIFSTTFADDRIGILFNGVYQKRHASVNQANVGYRDGYLGSENNWGSLAQPGDPRAANITNRPGPNDVYEVPQNASYDVNDISRERINGQLVLQAKPTDSLTATVDYTYSRNEVKTRNANVGIWFNHNNTSSAWTDGPVAGPVFYTERFTPGEAKDLSYSSALTAYRTENKSLGGNLTWEAPGGVTMAIDAHHSTAESKPTNKYGNSNSLGTAIFGVASQSINFDNDLPVISYAMQPGIDPLNAALITPTGNAFRNSYFRDRINQVQVKGHYDHEGSFLDSIDWGFAYTDNKVRSAYGVLQNDTWGGTGGDSPAARAAAAALLPDDIFKPIDIPSKFKGIDGTGAAGMAQQFYGYNFEQVVGLLDQRYGICGGDGNCLTPYTTDRRIREKTVAPYLQINNKFDLFNNPAHFIAGLRYENTTVRSTALVPLPSGTRQNSQNEFNVINVPGQNTFTTFTGSYDEWLPSFDFDVQPIRNVKLRASYSHTITRADYGSLQGGLTIDQLFRAGGNGTGGQGNPNLVPFKSKNIDLSAEWYYTPESYISAGYFHKKVSNYIGTTQVRQTAFGLTDPSNGPRYRAALAALAASGQEATFTNIRNYIATNYPNTVTRDADGVVQTILGTPEDAPVNFVISTPFNSDDSATIDGFEFAIQHSFWNTGFGTNLNYTIVNGNRDYNNALPASVSQFSVNGLSDSANASVFYDKNGLQARASYNWRAKFLAGGGINPYYTEGYGQLDATASWEFIPGVTVFAEAINLTGADRRGHRRSDRNVTFVVKQDARYSGGVRINF